MSLNATIVEATLALMLAKHQIILIKQNVLRIERKMKA